MIPIPAVLLLLAGSASAEILPAVPVSSSAPSASDARILWVVPNHNTVEEPDHFPPLTPRDKISIALNDSFDPYAFPVNGIYAGLDQWQDEFPSWGRGWTGFEKRYAVEFGNQTISNLLTEAVFPILLHEDPRYFRLGRGGIWHRLGYAASRVFVIKTDSGDWEFNYSEFAGNATMTAVSNAYIPSQDRTLGESASRFGIELGLDMAFNIGKEFWPDVRHMIVGR